MKHHTKFISAAFTGLFMGLTLLSGIPAGQALAEEQPLEIQIEDIQVEENLTEEAQTEETQTEEILTEEAQTEASAADTDDSMADDEEPAAARIPQGLYEIVSDTNTDYLIDVRHCTVHESDSKTFQTFRSLDVNQQKFYIEDLSGSLWRISAVYSGEALTVSGDGSSFGLAPMEHPEDTGFTDAQSWSLRIAGKGKFYIRSCNGKYLTLDAAEAYSGASVILSEFTGNANQKWILNNTWISGTDVADTDLVNPYGEDGPCRNLRITLQFGENSETIDAEEFAAHTAENEEHEYVLDQTFIVSFLEQLASKYDTQGQARRFITSHGNEITLTEGNFGWKLDTEGTKALIQENLNGESPVTLEPAWSHKGITFEQDENINDIGNSYIEVDLTNQKVWLYKNGRQLLESDCVSGTMGTEAQTPSGVYSIYYRQSPAVLNGPGYSSPVTYWMAFYGGFGLHDATWRNEFGGEIYKTNGSHGCVNLPTDSAETIYQTAEIGFPVILYY